MLEFLLPKIGEDEANLFQMGLVRFNHQNLLGFKHFLGKQPTRKKLIQTDTDVAKHLANWMKSDLPLRENHGNFHHARVRCLLLRGSGYLVTGYM